MTNSTEWTLENGLQLFNLPFSELIYQAQTVHRQYFDPNKIQISTLLNIKTGKCPENCGYCSQSGHHASKIASEPLMSVEQVLSAAKQAKAAGSTRFCMGAAWRSPKDRDLDVVCNMITKVKALGLETCVTLGMLEQTQAEKLKAAGLDFYNHNIDTSPEYYSKVVTTRTFQDRLNTLEKVRNADIKVCCGGILGLGENNQDRIKMLIILANLPQPPESLPINKLIKIPGTPLADQSEVDPIDFVRTIALARIMLPKTFIRLSAGRENMPEELQALCFIAGANSIFYGEKLLTTKNAMPQKDEALLAKLGLEKCTV